MLEEACTLALELFEARVATDLHEERERAQAVADAEAQVKAELAAMVAEDR